MRKSIAFLCIAAAVGLGLAAFGHFGPTFAQQPQQAQPLPAITQHACNMNTRPGFAHCDAIVLMRNSKGITFNAKSSTPQGLNPVDLQSAYNLPSTSAGSGQTIAIVDAMDDPNAEADLGVYRQQFGLAPCTIANGCFKKVDQTGGTAYPQQDNGWAGEISLDVDMISAVCPNCHILLVEANTASDADLGVAVNEAVTLGANVVSNSYGSNGPEDPAETSSAQFYNHPGTIITASAGDGGFGVEAPAVFTSVVAVGGTNLKKDGSARGWSETAWGSAANANGGTGSGCSIAIAKPSWQKDTGCAKRTVADVSADAEPQSGVSMYDSLPGPIGPNGQPEWQPGWLVFGGTSASAPMIAGVYGLAGNARSLNAASSLYSNTDKLNDVTSGTNGTCNPSYLCTAGPGYDGPTGVGTPNGIGAF